LGQTLLHCATINKNLIALEYFIDQGLDVNETDNKKETPLYMAVEANWVDGVKMLLNKGANIQIANVNGITPVTLANSLHYNDIVNAIINK
jgi:ankyrin repeat protein